jgi:hypothetical protein
MRRTPNPELDRIILDALARRYKLLDKREGIHLSSLIYCLTKGYLDFKSPIEPTDTELLNFATGYGLQELLFPADETVYEKDGITYRPDGTLQVRAGDVQKLIEIKSTRSGVKRYQEGNLPETWMTYMKGGCYIRGTTTYDLGVIYLAERPSAKILSETIEFEPEEIEENWMWLIGRRDAYKKSLDEEIPITPFTTAPEWLCNGCRYINVCGAIKLMEDNR